MITVRSAGRDNNEPAKVTNAAVTGTNGHCILSSAKTYPTSAANKIMALTALLEVVLAAAVSAAKAKSDELADSLSVLEFETAEGEDCSEALVLMPLK